MKSIESGIQEVGKRYDDLAYKDSQNEYYQYSDFLNFGYWDEHTANQGQACENLVEKLLDFIPIKKGTILDVACGKGATTHYFLKYFLAQNVTGINISEKQLETASLKSSGCTFFKMNATALKFEDNTFDNIICVEAAFHFNTREIFFKEANRVLKPGGYLVLSDILMTQEADRRRKYRIEKNYVKDLKEYDNILNRSGFQEVKVVDATEPCWKGHFLNVVCFFNQKFFSKEIDQTELKARLELTYRRVPDTMYYILVAARKR